MKRKNISKIIVVIMTLVMALVTLSGCAESIQTDEEIVVPKESAETDQSGVLAEEGASGAAPGSLLSGIAEQVQAPERYVAELSEGIVHVKADAPVVIPMATGFKLYKVTSRAFTQEDYDNIDHVLLKDGELWDRDEEKMEKSNGFTRQEIEEKIAQLKEQKQMVADGNKSLPGKEETYDEAIAAFEEMLDEAPEEPIIVEIPPVVCHTENPEEAEKNWLNGYVTVDGEDYFVTLDNNLRDDWKWVQFEVRSPRYQGLYMPISIEDGNAADENISPEKVRKDAKALMAELGFDEFAIAGEEYVQAQSWDELTDTARAIDNRYKIYFTRTLNEIPVTYTYEFGGTTNDADEAAWPYETISFIYGEKGLENFLWANPYKVEEAGDEYVFLLPFSDIQTVFEKIMPKKHADWYEDGSAEIYFEINEVRLGYMRVREKGNTEEGTMIPVWDFFGSETVVYGDSEEMNVKAGPYESLLTINAMDGTVIDRAYGY